MPVNWLDAVLRYNKAGLYWVVKRPATRSRVVERLSTGTNIGERLHTGPWADCKGLVGGSRLSRADRGKSCGSSTWSWLTRPDRGKRGRLRTVGGFNLIHLERPILAIDVLTKLILPIACRTPGWPWSGKFSRCDKRRRRRREEDSARSRQIGNGIDPASSHSILKLQFL